MEQVLDNKNENISFQGFKEQVLADYRIACVSREVSISGRKEVFSGKGKFGVFGDGKELAQIAMSKVFKKGDYRAGYYRDQTLMFALGVLSVEQFFSQIYAYASTEFEPSSGGRQMNAHFATRMLDDNGDFICQTENYNITADLSSTSGQIPKLVGLAQASKIYRESPGLDNNRFFSVNGNEIAFGTIGDASTSQGLFWEGLNAAGIMQVPMVLSIWDDGYGISVPSEYHHTKGNIYDIIQGFQANEKQKGIEILQVNGWDYPSLIKTYQRAEILAREKHIPVVVHVKELTQQTGHSTSGSHERYKDATRLEWEKEHDCLIKFEEWILSYEISNNDGNPIPLATLNELKIIQKEAKEEVIIKRKKAWKDYTDSNLNIKQKAIKKLTKLLESTEENKAELQEVINSLGNSRKHYKVETLQALRKVIQITVNNKTKAREKFIGWFLEFKEDEQRKYSSHLFSESKSSYKNASYTSASFDENKEDVDGRLVLRNNFDKLLERHPNLVIFGEDVGKIGDVNQGLEGLQDKYGEKRIFDTGIRESTIVGQGIGMAMRGLRPIAEIQYLDYVLYGLETIADDIACLQYRTAGGQKAPVIIRTRGHRLEGIWHSGSPMAGLLNFMRGVLFLVPRNLTKAAGFYNTLMQCDDPAFVVEPLNGYRLKEQEPNNLSDFTTPIGEVEITKQGKDLTIVTYGSTWRIVSNAAEMLKELNIDVEVIDVQSLLPFDNKQDIAKSLEKTNRLLVVDEDVPGGASAFILQKIIDEQNAYFHLDSKPMCLTAKEHRPPYSSDGDYFSKPSADDIVEKVYEIMSESNPKKYPSLFQ